VAAKLRTALRPWIWGAGLLCAALLHSQDTSTARQNESARKQGNDYMSQVLQRDTAQLGLKGDPALTRLLKEPSINWAIRASVRHILN